MKAHQVVSRKHQLLLQTAVLILAKHTSTNDIVGVLVELLEREGCHRSSDLASHLATSESNKVRHREQLCLRLSIASLNLKKTYRWRGSTT